MATGKTSSQKSIEIADTVCEPVDLYLYKTAATPTITSDASIGDLTLTVDAVTGVVVGHAITLFEGDRIHQNIVTVASGTTITLAAPLDYAYTTATTVETGAWNMAVDGSSTTQVYSIHAQPLANLMVHQINCSILDSTAMDDGKFGGIAALTNGIIMKYDDSIKKHLAVIVNNLGFWEIGFDAEYSDKAPAGQYGFKARRDLDRVSGTVLELTGSDSAEFQIHVQDDLTDLDLMACTINGHIVCT